MLPPGCQYGEGRARLSVAGGDPDHGVFPGDDQEGSGERGTASEGVGDVFGRVELTCVRSVGFMSPTFT